MSDTFEIFEQDVHPAIKSDPDVSLDESRSARAIVIDDDKNIALINVRNRNYYMLPGGRADFDDESYEVIARREVKEEVGVDIADVKPCCMTNEYRYKRAIKKVSQCFIARVDGEKGKTEFTQKEIHRGFELVWVKPEKALDLITASKPEDYTGPFNNARDTYFLKQAISNGSLD